jgi:hypothetical protein
VRVWCKDIIKYKSRLRGWQRHEISLLPLARGDRRGI